MYCVLLILKLLQGWLIGGIYDVLCLVIASNLTSISLTGLAGNSLKVRYLSPWLVFYKYKQNCLNAPLQQPHLFVDSSYLCFI